MCGEDGSFKPFIFFLMKKPNLSRCESFVLENGSGVPKEIVLIPVALFLEEGANTPQAVSGTDLSASQNGEYSLASRETARAFCQARTVLLGDQLVVFPLADAPKDEELLVRIPQYEHKRLTDGGNPPKSECRLVPSHYVFTAASWVAFIKKK